MEPDVELVAEGHRTGLTGSHRSRVSDMTTSIAVGTDAEVDVPRFREGAGRLCLDFVRTLRHRGTSDEVDELPDDAALVAWILQFGPKPMGVRSAGEDDPRLRDALRLREAVYELIAAGRSPEGVGSSSFLARELVNRAAHRPSPTPRVDASGALSWHAVDSVEAMLALVARDAVELVTSAAMNRVRECAGPSCGALFSDNSRPGNRRWCSMGACGNRAKKDTIRSRGGRSSG
jgi:predicted RNA-binding Zn ribbon-like protein